MWFQFSGTPQKRGFGCTCVLCRPRPERFRQPGAWAPSPRMRRAFSLCGERPRQPEACVPSPRVRGAFSLRGERLGQPEAWAHFPQMWRAFSLCSPGVHCQSGLRKSSDRNPRLPSKTMCRFSGRLMSAASDQKLFCNLCSPFCCSFNEFVEEKVITRPIPPPS